MTVWKRAHKMPTPSPARGGSNREHMPRWDLQEVPSDLSYGEAPGWFEVEIGRRLTRPSNRPPVPRRDDRPVPAVDASWGPAALLGPNLRLQVRTGYRAAIKEVEPGLFVVGTVPAAAESEFGFIPLIAPALLNTLVKALGPVIEAAKRKKAANGGAAPPVAAPAIADPAPAVEDAGCCGNCRARRAL